MRKLRLSASKMVADRISDWTFDIVVPAKTRVGWVQRTVRDLLVRPERVATPLLGPIAFQMLRTACQLGLFEYLEDHPGATAQEIKAQLKLTDHSAGVLLLGLCSLKLVHRIRGQYYNDPFLVKILLKNFGDGFTEKWMDFMQHLVAPAAMFLPESVTEDRAVGMDRTLGQAESFYQAISLQPEVMRHFDAFMRATTSINEDRVAALDTFRGNKRLIDVGGGTGNLALALAKHHPHLHITVFDFPKVIEVAAERFAESSDPQRLAVLAGNIQQAPIPTGYDCIVFSHFMGVFSEEVNQHNVRKAYEALDPGGTLCLFTPVCRDDQSGPVSTGLFSSYFLFLANGKGRFYSAQTYVDWMNGAGFRNVKTIDLPAHEAVFLATKQ